MDNPREADISRDDAESVSAEDHLDSDTMVANSADEDTIEEVRSKTSEGTDHGSETGKSIMSPQATPRSEDKTDSKKKFRIIGLRHPGEWKRNEKLFDLFTRAQQFHIWFDPHPKSSSKLGGISFMFDTIESARQAFSDCQKLMIDGSPVKLQASKSFYEPARRLTHHFTVSSDIALRNRTLYALHLLENTPMAAINAIFGDIESMEILPVGEKRVQAEIVMPTEDAALSAKTVADKFEQSYGDETTTLRVLSPSEYKEWVEKASKPQPFLLSPSSTHAPSSSSHPLSSSSSSCHPPSSPPHPSPRKPSHSSASSQPKTPTVHSHNKQVHPFHKRTSKQAEKPIRAPVPLPTEIPTEEPEVKELVDGLNSLVAKEKINWAEIQERDDLYELVDKVSYAFNGVRDALLKEAMLTVLESSKNSSEGGWMRRHIEDLIKLWKKEVASEVLFDRPSRVPLQARPIQPLPVDKKRSKGGGAALRHAFGVGAVLATARVKFGTEDGELDVDEDEHGNIRIGDEPLSFDSWAKYTQLPTKRPAPVEDKTSEQEERKENRKAKRAKLEEEKKRRKEEDKAKRTKEVAPKELEEGEMDSEEEKKVSSASSSSSSSSSSDSDSQGKDSRRRRRFRRKADRNKSPSLPPLFQSIYDNRQAIFAQLSVDHKLAFSNILSQFVNQKGGFNDSQQRAMMSYMTQHFGQSSSR